MTCVWLANCLETAHDSDAAATRLTQVRGTMQTTKEHRACRHVSTQ